MNLIQSQSPLEASCGTRLLLEDNAISSHVIARHLEGLKCDKTFHNLKLIGKPILGGSNPWSLICDKRSALCWQNRLVLQIDLDIDRWGICDNMKICVALHILVFCINKIQHHVWRYDISCLFGVYDISKHVWSWHDKLSIYHEQKSSWHASIFQVRPGAAWELVCEKKILYQLDQLHVSSKKNPSRVIFSIETGKHKVTWICQSPSVSIRNLTWKKLT